MKPLSRTSKIIRFLCACLVGYSAGQAIICFVQESNWGMIYLTVFLLAGLFMLVINTWHD